MYNKDHLKKKTSEFVIQAVYLCVGLMIAFPIIYALSLIHISEPTRRR